MGRLLLWLLHDRASLMPYKGPHVILYGHLPLTRTWRGRPGLRRTCATKTARHEMYHPRQSPRGVTQYVPVGPYPSGQPSVCLCATKPGKGSSCSVAGTGAAAAAALYCSIMPGRRANQPRGLPPRLGPLAIGTFGAGSCSTAAALSTSSARLINTTSNIDIRAESRAPLQCELNTSMLAIVRYSL